MIHELMMKLGIKMKTLTDDEIINIEREQIRRETVREVLNLFRIPACDFYHNVPNDYGTIDLILLTGKGDPYEKYRGREIVLKYGDGERGSGNYLLNDATVGYTGCD